MTWLCAPDREPRLVGAPPGIAASVVFTARAARIAGDFRVVDLDDARLLLPGRAPIAVHVEALSLHGMAPWAHASSLPAPLRALVLALTAWLAASFAGYVVLRRAARTRLGVLTLGAVGPLAALGLMRLLERSGAHAASFLVVPVVAGAATWLAAVLFSRLRQTRLRQRGGAASSWIKV
jgi:hypothetical protein